MIVRVFLWFNFMSDVAIRVKNVSKVYQIYDKPQDRLKQSLWRGRKQFCREFRALDDVSFEVRKGETIGIIGRNGSGKSTLLQIICGTLAATSGSVAVNGRVAALLELGAGFNKQFTGRENVYMNASILGLHKEEIDEKYDDIVRFAEIGDFIDQSVGTYSSGMFVRLAFAVQSVVDPDVFIIDEALAVGDEKFQRKCFARLEQLKSKGTSILFVSHSPSSIIELCDKTLFLDHGRRLMFAGAAETVRAYQQLIYAPEDVQLQLSQEYRLDDCQQGRADSSEEMSSAASKYESLKEAFDPSLVPETTTVYPEQGARICAMQVCNEQGEVVNLLQPGEVYKIIVSGLFLSDIPGVFFGLHIRNVSGLVITGQRFPEDGAYIKDAMAGKKFHITFSFRMDLLPGVYFVGGGIWANEEPSCTHRILDACMFRVMHSKKLHSFGYVDLSSVAPYLVLT